MIFSYFRSHAVWGRCLSGLVVFLTLAVGIAGCSMVSDARKNTKKIVRKVTSADGDLIKKVGVAFFEDPTGMLDDKYKAFVLSGFVSGMETECPDMLLVHQGQAGYPADLTAGPLAGGDMKPLALISAGRRYGFDAVAAAKLLSVQTLQEQHGFFWFKKTRRYLQVQVLVEVFDMETGAKLLDETLSRKMETDGFGTVDAVQKAAFAPVIREAVGRLLPEMGERTCDAISARQWKGFVVAVQGKTLVVSSGSRKGVTSGDEFSLYSGGSPIDGAEGQAFMIPGVKTGKVRITRVFPDRSEAVLEEGEAVVPGDVIKPD